MSEYTHLASMIAALCVLQVPARLLDGQSVPIYSERQRAGARIVWQLRVPASFARIDACLTQRCLRTRPAAMPGTLTPPHPANPPLPGCES